MFGPTCHECLRLDGVGEEMRFVSPKWSYSDVGEKMGFVPPDWRYSDVRAVMGCVSPDRGLSDTRLQDWAV